MALPEREKAGEDKVIREAKKRGGFSRKWKSQSQRGVADRLVFLPSMFGLDIHIVEMKSPTGTLSHNQQDEIYEITSRKGRAYVIYGKAGAGEFFADIDRRHIYFAPTEELEGYHRGAVVYPANKRARSKS